MSAERVRQGEVGGVIHRVLCTWQLLGLAVKGPIPTLVAQTGLENATLHLVGGSFLAGKATWALSGYLPTKNADYCILVNEWAWLRSQSWLIKARSGLGFSFGVRAWTEVEIRCVKGMYRLKLVYNE